MKLALAQMQISSSMEENYQKALRFIHNAADAGAKLIFFFPVSRSSLIITGSVLHWPGIRKRCSLQKWIWTAQR